MDEYFTKKPGLNYEKLQISEVGKYSITKRACSSHIINIIKEYYSNLSDMTITDTTANNGGDTIRFGLNFKSVNAIEINPNEFAILKNNVEQFNLKNVVLYNSSFLDIIDTLDQDIIYIDAPWGGPEYKNKIAVNLFVDGKNITEIIKKIYEKNKFKMIILKVPKNYNFIGLFKWYDMRYDIHSMKNMVIIVIQKSIKY